MAQGGKPSLLPTRTLPLYLSSEVTTTLFQSGHHLRTTKRELAEKKKGTSLVFLPTSLDPPSVTLWVSDDGSNPLGP